MPTAGGGQGLEDDSCSVWWYPALVHVPGFGHPLLPQDCQTQEARYKIFARKNYLKNANSVLFLF